MEYRLQNTRGTTLILSDSGASVRRVEVATREGNFLNIALSPAARNQNLSRSAYAGATLGPAAGRVPDGWLLLGGRRILLAPNEGAHHLHGGADGLSDARWHCVGADRCAARFSRELRDGVGGYPGNRRFQVDYTLSDTNALTLWLRCETDAPTWVNLSHHLYWNLSGDFSKTVGDHRLQILSGSAFWNDSEHIPRRYGAVADTVLDFAKPVALGPRLESGDPQIRNARGLNNLFRLDEGDSGAPTVWLSHPDSGRTLSLATDLPAVVVYSGGYLDASLPLADGGVARPSCALALEPQLLPITPECRQACEITSPEHPYCHFITFQLPDVGI